MWSALASRWNNAWGLLPRVYGPVSGLSGAEPDQVLEYATTKVLQGQGRSYWGWAVSAAVLLLPRVWASVPVPEPGEVVEAASCLPPELAFYRKYTEAMLRRYGAMAMEAGRVPSLLGKELFRARVTNYVVHSFEDVVIFVHDVEKCMAKMDKLEQMLLRRIGVQQYTQAEVSAMTRLSLRTVVRQYPRALDHLTEVFLEVNLLEPRIACQEGNAA